MRWPVSWATTSKLMPNDCGLSLRAIGADLEESVAGLRVVEIGIERYLQRVVVAREVPFELPRRNSAPRYRGSSARSHRRGRRRTRACRSPRGRNCPTHPAVPAAGSVRPRPAGRRRASRRGRARCRRAAACRSARRRACERRPVPARPIRRAAKGARSPAFDSASGTGAAGTAGTACRHATARDRNPGSPTSLALTDPSADAPQRLDRARRRAMQTPYFRSAPTYPWREYSHSRASRR